MHSEARRYVSRGECFGHDKIVYYFGAFYFQKAPHSLYCVVPEFNAYKKKNKDKLNKMFN